MKPSYRRQASSRAQQQGATGIEFAVGFTMFFLVFYSLLYYTLVTLLQQGITQAAQEGARAVLQINLASFKNTQDYLNAATLLARTSVQQSVEWMPASVKQAITANGGVSVNVVTPAPTVTIQTSTGAQNFAVQTLNVSIAVPRAALTDIMPVLSNSDLGTWPPLPAQLTGKASVRVTPSFTAKK